VGGGAQISPANRCLGSPAAIRDALRTYLLRSLPCNLLVSADLEQIFEAADCGRICLVPALPVLSVSLVEVLLFAPKALVIRIKPPVEQVRRQRQARELTPPGDEDPNHYKT
jgi:hypothetical protein